jgi:hypothetical protein
MPHRKIISLKTAARIYDQLRKRYFLDSDALRPGTTLHIPPPANELIFSWLADNSDAIGQTDFDEDGDPEALRLNSKFMIYTIARETILHELTHIRLGPKPSCGGHSHAWGGARVSESMAWHKETVRLAQTGAIRL